MSDSDRGATNPLGPPQLPEVTRLNRNVLLVAGMATSCSWPVWASGS